MCVGRKRSLNDDEENTIMQTILKFSDRAVPVSHEHLADAVEMMVDSFPRERKEKQQFVTTGLDQAAWR